MTEILTAAQMRGIEHAAIESGEVSGLELMERAGRGVVAAVFAEWPELAQSSFRALVLCGPGNNGGDGFVVARLLKEWGWQVEAFLYGDPKKLPPDALTNYQRWCTMGTVMPWDDFAIEQMIDEGEHDLVVDALFGTGLTRAMPSDTARVWRGLMPRIGWAQEERAKFVAIDLPSGLCSDSGRNMEGAFPADLSVSFHAAKLGHYLCPPGPPMGGATWCGKTVVADIGLKRRAMESAQEMVNLIDGCNPLVLDKRHPDHKYAHGHALILSGGAGKTGAARLAARGALRIGAGLVTVGAPPSAQMEVASQITALMLARVDGADGLVELLEDKRLNALCLGPGLGVERARALVPVALAAGRASVLDADALTAFADDPQVLFDLLHDACVLTPHGGEFSRLFPDIYQKLMGGISTGPAYSKVDAAREAAERAGCVVLFKGPDTVIAAPDGRCSINAAVYDRAAPWLATAGSGDVLAGFITGLLARGFPPMQAAETAAWLHVECARAFGPGLIAEDLPEQIPSVYSVLRGKVK